MELNIGEIIKLDDGKEYIVIKTYQYEEVTYILMMSTLKPINIVLTKMQLIGDICQLFPVNDADEIKSVLNDI